MKRRRRNNVPSFGVNLLMLGIESQHAMALRLAKLSKGGTSAQRESARMLTEKLSAGIAAGVRMLSGGSPTRILKDYRSKVRANLRRLSK